MPWKILSEIRSIRAEKLQYFSIVPKAGVKIDKIGLICDTQQGKLKISRRSQAYAEHYSIRSTNSGIEKWIFFGWIGNFCPEAIWAGRHVGIDRTAGYKKKYHKKANTSNHGELRIALGVDGVDKQGFVLPLSIWSGESWDEIDQDIKGKRKGNRWQKL